MKKILAALSTFGLTSIAQAAETLRASDVSILIPLKATDYLDDVFKTEGSGMCNAPSMVGEKGPLSFAQFESFFKRTFGRGSSATCGSGRATRSARQSDAFLMWNDKNLAFERGYTNKVCADENWKIVSMRFDPCPSNLGKKFPTPADVLKCDAEIRLVAQPFIEGPNRWLALDFGIHLIYKVRDIKEVSAELKAFATVSRTAEAKTKWANQDSNSRTLQAHPGLRAEMENCGGPVTTAFRKLLTKYAAPAQLKQLAYFMSSDDVMRWTFGVENYNGTEFVTASTLVGQFDNYSHSIFVEKSQTAFPLNPSLKSAKFTNFASLFSPSQLMSSGKISEEDTREARGFLNDISNPHVTTSTTTSCFSCHMSDQVFASVARRMGTPSVLGPRPYPAPPTWSLFPQRTRSFLNFRNFGYGPAFEFGVSSRTVNETNDVLDVLKSGGLL